MGTFITCLDGKGIWMKKEITIDGKESDWFERATFILKTNDMEKVPDNLFTYAEEIIESYMKKHPFTKSKKSMQNCEIRPNDKQVDMLTLTKAYNRQMNYKKQQQNRIKRERQIHYFFYISMSLCIFSLLLLIFVQ